jgi:hypothetical protein
VAGHDRITPQQAIPSPQPVRKFVTRDILPSTPTGDQVVRRLRRFSGISCALGAGLLPFAAAFGSVNTSPNFGVNLWFHQNWTSDGAFVDVTKTFREFLPYGHRDLTAQGLPMVEATAFSFLRGYDEGIYRLRYEGTGNVSFSGLGQVLPDTVRTVNGVTYAAVRVDRPQANQRLGMTISGVRRNDPIRNLQLLAPGYGYSTTQMYRDEFINRIQPFSTLRFMDWARTNSSQISRWSDHRPNDYAIQTASSNGQGGGLSWNHMVRLANESRSDAWINVPHRATNNYIRHLANFWNDRLRSDRTLYVEFGNEFWNAMFQQHHEMKPDGPGEILYMHGIAPQIERVSRIFREVFADRSDRLKIVLAGQATNDWHVRKAIEHFTSTGRDPARFIDAIAIAPYFNVPNDGREYRNVDEFFSVLMDMSDEREYIRNHKRIADQYGMELISYEGGVEANFRRFVPQNIRDAALNDRRLGAAILRFARMWDEETGGALFNWYALTGSENVWGLLSDLRDPGSIRWDALMRHLLTPGDANLDGVVDRQDIQIFNENRGKKGFWEQGDFNGDGVVDEQDWQLLTASIRANATTPLEAATRLEFNALTDDELEHLGEFGIALPLGEMDFVAIAIPEPTTLTLLGAATLLLMRRRR